MGGTSRITIHMVSSLDGFIAKPDGDVSWMHSKDQYDKGVTLTEGEITDFLQSIDCYVMGSKTYETALELGWPYGDVPVYVLTSRKLKAMRTSIKFYNGDLELFLTKELKPKYKNVWMVGGSEVTSDFLNLGLADELVVSILPVIVGGGIRFFDSIENQIELHLKEEKAYSDGMVELTYEVRDQ